MVNKKLTPRIIPSPRQLDRLPIPPKRPKAYSRASIGPPLGLRRLEEEASHVSESKQPSRSRLSLEAHNFYGVDFLLPLPGQEYSTPYPLSGELLWQIRQHVSKDDHGSRVLLQFTGNDFVERVGSGVVVIEVEA